MQIFNWGEVQSKIITLVEISSNNMRHVTCMAINQGNCWLLMVESQIDNLTPNPSFGHNLCFKYTNGSCKPILNIYFSRDFQWYKELFNPISFDFWYHRLKIWKSIEISTPKCKFIPSHSPTLSGAWNVTPKLHF